MSASRTVHVPMVILGVLLSAPAFAAVVFDDEATLPLEFLSNGKPGAYTVLEQSKPIVTLLANGGFSVTGMRFKIEAKKPEDFDSFEWIGKRQFQNTDDRRKVSLPLHVTGTVSFLDSNKADRDTVAFRALADVNAPGNQPVAAGFAARLPADGSKETWNDRNTVQGIGWTPGVERHALNMYSAINWNPKAVGDTLTVALDFQVSVVPEPGAAWLLAAGLAGLLLRRRTV